MTAPDHLRITGPEDILGFIPHSLGYWPENSLVAMTLQGKRLGATLRVDLPVPGGDCTGGAGGGGSGGVNEPLANGRGSTARNRRSGSGRGDVMAAFARNVVGYLQADEAADGALLAFFTDADADADVTGDGTVWAALLKELELALEAAGMPLRDAWIIGAEFWRSAHCSDPECCGPAGRPVEQIKNSRLNAEMVYRGSSIGAAPGTRGTQTPPLPVDPAVRAAESDWAEQFSPRRRDRAQFDQVLDVWTTAMQAATVRQDPIGAASDSLAPGASVPDAAAPDTSSLDSNIPDAGAAGVPLELSPELAGYLRASLSVPSWRDAVLVMAAAGRSAAERGAEDFGMFDAEAWSAVPSGTMPAPRLRPTPSPLAGPEHESVSGPTSRSISGSRPMPQLPLPEAGAVPRSDAVPGYGEVLLGLAPAVPNWAQMVGLERVLEQLGRLGDGESTAAAVTARGWIEWCRGRGSYADALYCQALQEHPGYRLAELLAELGRRGTLCGWAARREAAWQKFAPDAA
ncbi:DUF4192 family protein [Arthrobacter sp. NPDC058130]|uniref:DUF4192 family protein n=1 Tax=Arthrobacter sp. NPDC058130 TaxID=3346353 RepID=UPI0036EF6C36